MTEPNINHKHKTQNSEVHYFLPSQGTEKEAEKLSVTCLLLKKKSFKYI